MRFLYEIVGVEGGPVAYVVQDPERGVHLVVPGREHLAELIEEATWDGLSPAHGDPAANLAKRARDWLEATEVRPVNPHPAPPYDPDIQH